MYDDDNIIIIRGQSDSQKRLGSYSTVTMNRVLGKVLHGRHNRLWFSELLLPLASRLVCGKKQALHLSPHELLGQGARHR